MSNFTMAQILSKIQKCVCKFLHTRPPCPSTTPGVYSNSCPLNWWYHPIISSSVIPFFSRLQSFPASGSFPMSQFITSSIRRPKYWSFSFNISPSNECSGLISFRMDWMNLLAVQATLKKKISPDLLRNYSRWIFCHSFLRSITPTVRANLWY